MKNLKLLLIMLLALLLFGCQSDEILPINKTLSSDTTKKNRKNQTTQTIVAHANPKIIYIDIKDSVHFDASSSYSLDGDIVNYRWVDQDDIVLSTKAVFDRVFYNEGIYVKTVEVTDTKGNSAFDQNVIIVGKPEKYILFTQPDFAKVSLSTLKSNKTVKTVKSNLVKYNETTNSIDHWVFDFEGGELEINILSETSNLGSFIDINRDNNQSELDTYIYLHTKDSDGNWQLIDENDDFSLANTDSLDGSTHYYDSYIKRELAEGEYMISVGTYPFYKTEALLDKKQSTSIYENIEGPYQISFNKNINFSQTPTNMIDNKQNINFFTFDVIKNDKIINSSNNNTLYLTDATTKNNFADIRIKENKILFYPNNDFSNLQNEEIRKIDIIYTVKDSFDTTEKNTLTIYITK